MLIFYFVIKHIIIDKTKNLYKLIIYYFLSTIKKSEQIIRIHIRIIPNFISIIP
jgi:hypothetical protein